MFETFGLAKRLRDAASDQMAEIVQDFIVYELTGISDWDDWGSAMNVSTMRMTMRLGGLLINCIYSLT